MAKLIVGATALFVFAVTFVGGTASAGVKVSEKRTYAAELFGEGSDTTVFDYGEGRLYVDVLLKNADDIAAANEATLRVAVSGAEFAAGIGEGDLSVVEYTSDFTAPVAATTTRPAVPAMFQPTVLATVTENPLAASKRDGGARGDSFVEFDINVVTTITGITDDVPAAVGGGDAGDGIPDDGSSFRALRIEMPALRKVAKTGVRVSVELEGNRRGSPWPEIPSAAMPLEGTETLFNAAASAMTVTTTGGSGLIDVDDRTSLYGKTMKVGAVMLEVDPKILQSDGNPFSVQDRRHSDGAGDVIISVKGNFQQGDELVWSWNGERGNQPEEMLSVKDGTAERAYDLDALFIGADEKQSALPVGGSVLYTPGGKSSLRDGEIEVTVMVDYDDSTAVDSLPMQSMATLRYSGDGSSELDTVKAYALAPISSGDETNVRLRCGQSFDCTIYLACDAADGTGFFGKMADPVEPWSVMTVDSGMIADVVGADDEDFDGRMSCDVIGATQVQVLTRSDGVLVNNSYVGQ